MRSLSKLTLLGLSFAGFGLATATAAHANKGAAYVAPPKGVQICPPRVGGLFQADFVSFSGDKEGVSRTSGDIRRAEIWIKGNLTQDWSYQLGYDARFTRLDTSWLGYAGFEPFWLAMGLINVPQSLEYWSGPANSTFMEYASVVQALQPPKGIGLYADGSAVNKILSYQAAIYVPNYEVANVVTDGYAFAQNINTTSFGTQTDAAGAALRVALNQDNMLGLKEMIHFGASIRYDGISSTQTMNPYVTTPNMLGKAEAFATNNILVQSVTPVAGSAKSVNTYGVEAAGIWGLFLLQGEFLKAHMNGREGNAALSYLGYYGQAAFMLTGEHRTYDQYTGTVGSVKKIHHPYGAWELAFRYGYVDLSDSPDEDDEIDDYLASDKRGKQTDYTLGLNWYVTENVKFMGNYSVAQAEYSELSPDFDGDSEPEDDANVKSIGVRVQVDF